MQRASGRFHLRYEDIAQDGRVRADVLPTALGVVWRALEVPGGARDDLRAAGIIPILTRLEIEAGPGPFGVERPLEVEGGFDLAHARSADGEIDKLLLDMDASIEGPIGRTNLPPPPDAGSRAAAGRVRAEHVFTRPFAPAGARKVQSLPVEGSAFVPERERTWEAPVKLLELPGGGVELESELRDDPVETFFGMAHTDSNQHVNSSVYPRIFEEAALRRFAELGRSTLVLARRIEIGYRRPSFAGETIRVALRAFLDGTRIGCTGCFYGSTDAERQKPRAYVRMVFE